MTSGSAYCKSWRQFLGDSFPSKRTVVTGEQILNSRFLVKEDVKAVTMYSALCIDSEETLDYFGQLSHAYE
jgi:hypothetical protein